MTLGFMPGREWVPMSFFRTVLLIAALLLGWVAMKGGLHVLAAPNAPQGTPTAQATP